MTVALAGTIALLGVGWLLRRLIPVRGPLTAVVPAAILGGFVALALRGFDVLPGPPEAWQDVAYHLFVVSFLAIGLTPSGDTKVAKGVLKAADAIGDDCDLVIEQLLGDAASIKTHEAVAYSLLARHYKRVSSHLSNVATAVLGKVEELDFRP